MGNPNAQAGAKNIWPKWLSQYAVWTYVLALATVSIIYVSYSIRWYYMLAGVVSVLVFYTYGHKAAQDTSIVRIKNQKNYEKRIFLIAFVPRVIWMFLIYFLFLESYGDSFGFENMDAVSYDDLGKVVAKMIKKGNFHFYDELANYTGNDDIADMGYGVYVGFIYWLTGNSIIAVRLLKCVLSSWTVLLIYRLTMRNFGAQIARIAAIFCALWPNFWYYCGTHLKETEMVFLTVLFVEQAEQMLRSRQFTAWKVIPILFIVALLFTFRTVLALVAVLALLFAIMISSSKVVSWGKRLIIGLLVLSLMGVTVGNRIAERSQELVEKVQSGYQKGNMEWRASREDTSGHKQDFAKYASAAVFAPMIFTIPFPSMVNPFEGQELQELLNGGNFIKNILSFFVIFSLSVLLLSGRWREHVLPISFLVGYLIVLTVSAFAHSERFHQPVMPFEFMFMAYGLVITVGSKRYKRWFMGWCVLMFFAAFAWSWFKLAGRGLI